MLIIAGSDIVGSHDDPVITTKSSRGIPWCTKGSWVILCNKAGIIIGRIDLYISLDSLMIAGGDIVGPYVSLAITAEGSRGILLATEDFWSILYNI